MEALAQEVIIILQVHFLIRLLRLLTRRKALLPLVLVKSLPQQNRLLQALLEALTLIIIKQEQIPAILLVVPAAAVVAAAAEAASRWSLLLVLPLEDF